MATKKSAPPAPPSTSLLFFTWMRSLGIQREPGWVGGVFSGVATRIGIDPIVVRGVIVVPVVLAAVISPALLVYAGAWLLLPDRDDRIHLEQLFKGNVTPAVAGVGLLAVFSFLPFAPAPWVASNGTWQLVMWDTTAWRIIGTIAVFALAAWFVLWVSQHPARTQPSKSKSPTPPVAPPTNGSDEDFAAWREDQAAWKAETAAFRQQQESDRALAWRTEYDAQRAEVARARAEQRARRRTSRADPILTVLTIGIALTSGGVTMAALSTNGLTTPDLAASLAVGLAVLAIGIIVSGLRGKRPGVVALIAALVTVPLMFVTVFPESNRVQYSGDAVFAPEQPDSNFPDLYLAGDGDVYVNMEHYYAPIDVKGPLPNSNDPTESFDQSKAEHVYIFVLSGDVHVSMPFRSRSSIEATAPTGGVRSEVPRERDSYERQGTTFATNYEPPLVDTLERRVVVHVFALTGKITITNPREDLFWW